MTATAIPVTRSATCRCGQLSITVTGDPIRISVCHCLACKQRTGSAFGYQARYPREQTRIDGRSTEYVRIADSGNSITYHFCPQCGSTAYYMLSAVPGAVAVPVGGFADPDFPPPRFSVYENRRHAWVDINAPVERD
jgi:hypothetical protein